MPDASNSSIPDPDAADSVPASVDPDRTEDEASAAPDLPHVPEAHREALRRLHKRVEEAVRTIRQLRTRNEQLRRRVQELEARPALPDDQTLLALDDDPEAFRDRISGFIDAIDAYLDATDPDREGQDPRADGASASASD